MKKPSGISSRHMILLSDFTCWVYMHMWSVCIYVYVPCACPLNNEARNGHRITWHWRCELHVDSENWTWVFSGRVYSAVKHWAFSPAIVTFKIQFTLVISFGSLEINPLIFSLLFFLKLKYNYTISPSLSFLQHFPYTLPICSLSKVQYIIYIYIHSLSSYTVTCVYFI